MLLNLLLENSGESCFIWKMRMLTVILLFSENLLESIYIIDALTF